MATVVLARTAGRKTRKSSQCIAGVRVTDSDRLELSRLLGALLASEWKDQSRIRNIEAAVRALLELALRDR